MVSKEKLKNLFELSDASVQLIMENVEIISLKKGAVIVREEQRNDYAYFLTEGLVRGYIFRDGKPITILIAFEGRLIVSPSTLSTSRTSKLTIEASEDVVLLRILVNELEDLFSKSIELANWGRKLAEKNIQEYDDYFINYFWEDKGTQYHSLIRDYPELLQRLSLKDIASYLNITPQSLSRIRAKQER